VPRAALPRSKVTRSSSGTITLPRSCEEEVVPRTPADSVEGELKARRSLVTGKKRSAARKAGGGNVDVLENRREKLPFGGGGANPSSHAGSLSRVTSRSLLFLTAVPLAHAFTRSGRRWFSTVPGGGCFPGNARYRASSRTCLLKTALAQLQRFQERRTMVLWQAPMKLFLVH